MESRFEALFPLVFIDCNTTMNMGNIPIEPSLNFKAFQSVISQKIGISPHQITIYFERRHLPLPYPVGKVSGGRRTLVTNKFNFAAILHEGNCFFFVVSKRSRRVRRRKRKQSNIHDASGAAVNYPIHAETNSLDSFEFLGRNSNLPFGGTNFPYAGQIQYTGFDYLDYTKQMRSFVEGEKESYLMSTNMNSDVFYDLNLLSRMNNRSYRVRGREVTSDDGASSSRGVSSAGAGRFRERAASVCDVCSSAKNEGQTVPFHSCKCDAIIPTVFRSPAGPIARPKRIRVDPSGI